VTSGGGFTDLVDKVLYAVTAVLVVCSLSFAAQRTFFEPVATVDDRRAQATLPATAREAARSAISAGQSEQEDGAADPGDLAAGRGTVPLKPPAAGQGRPTPDPTGAGSRPEDASGAQPRQAPASGSWSVMSALGSMLPFGSASSAGAAAKPTSDPPRIDAPASRPSAGAQLSAISFSTDEGNACQPGPLEFQLTDVPDLYVCVALKGLSGKYAGKVTFLLPDGNVYQAMNVPFLTADMPTSADPSIEVDGRTLEAKRAGWGANGLTLVTARLPVAGTFITQYTLAGAWTVQVALDGNQVGREYFELLTP